MNKIEIPLDIPGVEGKKVEINLDSIVIFVKSIIKGTCCSNCGRNIYNCYGSDDEITLRHLSIFGKKTYIRICPLRYECPFCPKKPTTTQNLPWYYQRSPHTKAYDNHVLLSLVNSTVEDVSVKEGIGYEAVMGAIKRCIGNVVNWAEFKKLVILGLDEISLKKGHKDFVTIVTCRIEGQTIILGVLVPCPHNFDSNIGNSLFVY